jgi:hypothetical protein
MATVVVNPISQISVRVGPGAPAQIQSTAQFLGASDQTALVQRIYDVANTALETANTAASQVAAAYYTANSAQLYANGAFIKANSAYASQNTTGIYANTAFTAANTAASDALAYAIALG